MIVSYPYFNPFRKTHANLMKYLEQQLVNDTDKIRVVKYGTRTEHVFVNDNYLMTINWALV